MTRVGLAGMLAAFRSTGRAGAVPLTAAGIQLVTALG